MAAITYPRRPPHFAHKFCRLLTKSAAALEIGPEVCWLLTVIAHQEDAKRYRGPANYWNHQLMGVVGVSSIGRLDRIRNAAVAAGWLHYEAGGKGKIGSYWVLVPKAVSSIDDSPSDESDADLSIHLQSQNATTNRHANGYGNEQTTGMKPSRETGDNQETTRRQPEHKPSTFYPSPNPSPLSETRGVEFEVSPGVTVDWTIAESEFMARWNATDGVTHYSRTNVPQDCIRAFQDRYLEPGWRERAEKALKKFPLANGNVMTLGTFLRDGKVDEILGGSNDWTRGKRANANRQTGGLYHESNYETDFLVDADAGNAAEAG